MNRITSHKTGTPVRMKSLDDGVFLYQGSSRLMLSRSEIAAVIAALQEYMAQETSGPDREWPPTVLLPPQTNETPVLGTKTLLGI